MKSICIKTNNSNLLDYLLTELNLLDLEPICFSSHEFKHYKNIIIHYTGKNEQDFIARISSTLSYLVIDELEESLLKELILKNYFYFNSLEQKQILDICYTICSEDFTNYFDEKYTCLTNNFTKFLNNHHSLVLSGFVNFRIQNYKQILESIVDDAVNQFIIEREYKEFISLLKLYIHSQKSQIDTIHLLYLGENSFLLDDNKNKIAMSNDILNAKYLSDISFSTNDYLLNTLLNLLPKEIHIHLIENCVDEFIQTLLLIFENQVKICTDCSICQLYKNHSLENISIKR